MRFFRFDMELPSDVVVNTIEITDFSKPRPGVLSQRMGDQSIDAYSQELYCSISEAGAEFSRESAVL